MDNHRAQARMSRILVLKLGALGNIILSLGPFAAIRRHHAGDHITLLTTRPWAGWLAGSPYFDSVLIDERPSWWNLPGVWRLKRQLAEGCFDRVYDLQTSTRSSHYLRLFPRTRRPQWSGIAPGCSHPDRNPQRDHIHDIDRQIGQLSAAGVMEAGAADLSWTSGDLVSLDLPTRFALLVPGSSAHRPAKRWPAAHFTSLAKALLRQGLTPVVLGTAQEGALAREIQTTVPETIDLTGRTGLPELASLGRAAALAVGNDTGPMHLLAAAGCASFVLFSTESDPVLCAPRGRSVTVLQRTSLADLDPAAVLAALKLCPPLPAPETDEGRRPRGSCPLPRRCPRESRTN
jgi:ADP-heptose:LPS heptosyltransferase